MCSSATHPPSTWDPRYRFTNGDKGRVMSGLIMEPARFDAGSTQVLIGGNLAVRLTTPTSHNQNNAISAVLVPSQTVVLISS
ncbi:PAAR-like domain-containing protein [Caballeronia sp. LZ035]|uniref:PAAR-like domain-containing protein n=1 Tax=Caballeronia sp. LZ035 TaxID=3038568 RepID=UPI00285B0CB0|nr:PAAR-like domain-containing protein [Caballeronia sp. LZ035]MDR5758879.1 DUF4150 domain-containing protein [Caballeronia sp. LZ035]